MAASAEAGTDPRTLALTWATAGVVEVPSRMSMKNVARCAPTDAMPVMRTSAPMSSPRPAAICSGRVIGVARLGDLGAPGGVGQEKRERFVEEFA